jgi:hypothetical protein
MLKPAATATTLRSSAVIALVALALAAGGCAQSLSNGNDNAGGRDAKGGGRQDVAALQGRWEQLPEEPGPGSPRQRVLKDVNGETEVVTTFDADGRPIQSQTAKFRLSRVGGVPIYTFSGARVTAGAGEDSDKPSSAPRSYIYKLRGNDFYEVWGLLPGQEEREVMVRHWKRVTPGGR